MKFIIFSHKACWKSASSPIGYATDGGFVYHMQAIASVASEMRLVVPTYTNKSTAGEIPFKDPNIAIVGIPSKYTFGIKRHLEVLLQLPRLVVLFLREMRAADVIHLPIPGDYGAVALFLSRFFNKPLWVRHCADFARPKSWMQRWVVKEMERRAGGQNVFFATGGAPTPPSNNNPNIQWIFSSSLLTRELEQMGRLRTAPEHQPWRLITVSRQSATKGTGRLIQTLPLLLEKGYAINLSVVGDGEDLPAFKKLATDLGVAHLVTFHGKLNSAGVYNQLQQADLFAYPTRASEGFPKVVLEAMAAGLPVVTNPISVLPVLIGSTGAGTVMIDGEPAELAAALSRYFEDPTAYADASKKALETAKNYSLENWVAEMCAAINSQTQLKLRPLRDIVK
jgi:glycosyltransferase involved in cell wall biosynthesis